MLTHLKQFVPSTTCLKCEGCCRFQLSDSPWRPKTGQKEQAGITDELGYVRTTKAGDHHQCVFFSQKDGTCGIYSNRPFECSLYPFIVSGTPNGIKLYMHLACPYIQEKEVSPELEEYITYLKDFFNQPSTKEFLKTNSRLLHDYSPFDNELRFLFNIEV